MDISPFHFRLKKIDSQALLLEEALFSFLPRTGLREPFHHALHETLDRHLGTSLHYSAMGMAEMSGEDFASRLSDPACVVVLGIPPLEGKLFIDIDLVTALAIIERMLGARQAGVHAIRPLTDIEQGVLQYLLLQLISHTHRLCGEDKRLHFRFERLVSSPDGLRGLSAAAGRVVAITFSLRLGQMQGIVRLCFPHQLIEGAFLDAEPTTAREQRDLLERLRAYEHVRFPIWAEAGRTTVRAAELAALELGDVVLFDQSEVILENAVPTGRVVLRAGQGREGGFLADLSAGARKIHCRLLEAYRGEGT